MRNLALLLAAFWLLVPGISVADHLFGIADHPRGAARYTVNKFGYNADVDTAEESVWDAGDVAGGADPARCFANMNTGTTPTAADLYISSDDENDASDNDGVVITVEGLDANWDLTSTTVALGVASAGGTVFAQIGTATWMRVNRAFVASTSGAAPVGNIYIGIDTADGGTDGIPDTIATDLVAVITIGENQTLQACYSVPNDYDAYLTNWCITNGGVGATALTVRMRASINGAAARNQLLLTMSDADSACNPVSPPQKFVEKTDIEFTGAVATSQNASARFDLVLIKSTLNGLGE